MRCLKYSLLEVSPLCLTVTEIRVIIAEEAVASAACSAVVVAIVAIVAMRTTLPKLPQEYAAIISFAQMCRLSRAWFQRLAKIVVPIRNYLHDFKLNIASLTEKNLHFRLKANRRSESVCLQTLTIMPQHQTVSALPMFPPYT